MLHIYSLPSDTFFFEDLLSKNDGFHRTRGLEARKMKFSPFAVHRQGCLRGAETAALMTSHQAGSAL